MTSPAPRIKKLRMLKASGEIKLAIPEAGKISNIKNDLNIRYQTNKNKPDNTLRVSLLCDIHTLHAADAEDTSKLKASVEIIYEVTLSSNFDPKYLDETMQAVWPYLRAGAVHQLQLINLKDVGETLPYAIGPSHN